MTAVLRHWLLKQTGGTACGAEPILTTTGPGHLTCATCIGFLARNGCLDGKHTWPVSGGWCYCQKVKWQS